jgi:hypothetical protein
MDLDLIETSALLDELFKRFDHAVFSGIRGHDKNKYAVAARYKGNAFTCHGLAGNVAKRALDDWRQTSEDADTEDL